MVIHNNLEQTLICASLRPIYCDFVFSDLWKNPNSILKLLPNLLAMVSFLTHIQDSEPHLPSPHYGVHYAVTPGVTGSLKAPCQVKRSWQVTRSHPGLTQQGSAKSRHPAWSVVQRLFALPASNITSACCKRRGLWSQDDEKSGGVGDTALSLVCCPRARRCLGISSAVVHIETKSGFFI